MSWALKAVPGTTVQTWEVPLTDAKKPSASAGRTSVPLVDPLNQHVADPGVPVLVPALVQYQLAPVGPSPAQLKVDVYREWSPPLFPAATSPATGAVSALRSLHAASKAAPSMRHDCIRSEYMVTSLV